MAISVINAIETHDVVEKFVEGLVKSGSKPSQIIVGLHNAMVHGTLLEEEGYDVDEVNLGELFDSIDELQKKFEQIEVSE